MDVGELVGSFKTIKRDLFGVMVNKEHYKEKVLDRYNEFQMVNNKSLMIIGDWFNYS